MTEERYWELAEEWAAEEWAAAHDLSLWDEIKARVSSGVPSSEIATDMATEIGPLEREVTFREPDEAQLISVSTSRLADLVERLASEAENKRSEGGGGYMPTDDVVVRLDPGRTSGDDNQDLVRFQTEASAKERAIAEGFAPDGRKLRLFEICERRAIHGDTVRWEIRNVDGGDLTDAGGPLFLDSPQHNDAALAEARGQAYAAIRDACESNYRDLRGSNKMADEKERTRKVSLLRDVTAGLKLAPAHRRLLASVEEQIEGLSDEFISSIAGILKQPWDPGSSWEVVEAGGAPRIVRRETKLDDDTPTKHAFREGQTLRVDAGVVPDDVVIRECLGDSRYKVQSVASGSVFLVDEQDLYDPSGEESVFEGGGSIGLGDLANLF